MISYGLVIMASWAAFLVVWGVGAFNVKRDTGSGGLASVWSRFFLVRFATAIVVLIVAVRAVSDTPSSATRPIFSYLLFTPPLFVGWIAAILTALGIVFAIWARVYLGRNWSSAPAMKEDHELVVSGPYRLVRHPIYTGIILATLGSALTGSLFGLGACMIVCMTFYRRIDKEERIMLRLFPATYPTYQTHTKKLIPFVW